ncbi:MAG TPA: adenylate/guanylate cyclase domain-containing protein [Thermohalobaculum sp.]|nr:adenylate/guanylate cyclase domain-containing protein [Thermohalobaculum sp.]
MVRRLAAILAADAVGFSKLVQADENATLERLKDIWTQVFDPAVAAHRGRIFKLMGDGALAEFSSAVDAVECAVEIQRALHARDSGGAAMKFRIGVHLGEIVVDGDDILGDGVNIAARLESAAPAGGVLVSDLVHSQVAGKSSIRFAEQGEIRLKNIAAPLRAWRWEGGATRPATTIAEKAGRERLSIAVLPFNNMSADPEQEFLADGISEDIITGLSKIRWFLVIARNSTFTYKGQAVDVKRVAEELGVRYVLEGSVRKSGNRVRVTAQLIDADTGLHVWAERYDRELDDIFELQDEITRTIVARIEPEISAAERGRVVRHRTDNLDAWECYQRGLWYLWDYGRSEHAKAIEFLTRATELDPNFSTAYAYLCYAYYEGVIMGWADDPNRYLALGMTAARRAIQIDSRDPVGYFAVGRIYMMKGEHDASIGALERAIELNPSFSQAHHGLSMVLMLAGRLDESRAAGEQVELLSPRDPILWATLVVHAMADVLAGDTESALLWVRKTKQTQRAKGYWAHAVYAAALAQAGRLDEARAALEDARRELPGLTISYLAKTLPPKEPGGLDPYLDALRAAGLPE